jgi:hypothetical protein
MEAANSNSGTSEAGAPEYERPGTSSTESPGLTPKKGGSLKEA